MTVTAEVSSAPTYSNCAHEARHVAAAWALGRMRVDSVSVGVHAAQAGVVKWTPLRSDRQTVVATLVASLAGWLGDEDLPESAVWPEAYPPRLDAPDNVGLMTDWLKLSKDSYEAICRIAEKLVENEKFKAAVRLVAKALMTAPRLDFESLEILRRVAGYDEPEGAVACST